MSSSTNMACVDTMTIHSDEDECEHDLDHDHPHPHNMSRLSICSSSKQSLNEFDDGGGGSGGDMMMMFMSGLSIESSYADEEFSEDDHKGVHMYDASSDSDKEISTSCLSLPGTPLQIQQQMCVEDQNKEYYCSETEAGGKGSMRNKTKRNSRRRAIRERWLDREWEKKKYNAKAMDGESECLVITKPNGGKKSMYMDLGEVMACRDLGFEMEIPSQISCSTIDTTSSGGNSPISSWRISSPGDDPKDVKARLKVWAQAVAASASRLVA